MPTREEKGGESNHPTKKNTPNTKITEKTPPIRYETAQKRAPKQQRSDRYMENQSPEPENTADPIPVQSETQAIPRTPTTPKKTAIIYRHSQTENGGLVGIRTCNKWRYHPSPSLFSYSYTSFFTSPIPNL